MSTGIGGIKQGDDDEVYSLPLDERLAVRRAQVKGLTEGTDAVERGLSRHYVAMIDEIAAAERRADSIKI